MPITILRVRLVHVTDPSLAIMVPADSQRLTLPGHRQALNYHSVIFLVMHDFKYVFIDNTSFIKLSREILHNVDSFH